MGAGREMDRISKTNRVICLLAVDAGMGMPEKHGEQGCVANWLQAKGLVRMDADANPQNGWVTTPKGKEHARRWLKACR